MKNASIYFLKRLFNITFHAVAAAFLFFYPCHAAHAQNAASADETGEVLNETGQLNDSSRKIAELSYKIARPSKIRKLTISPPAGIETQKRAKKIEILTSEFETEEDTYWLSSGTFTLSETAENVVCEFEPVEAQYIKIRILQCYGPEIYPNIGRVNIGLNTFKLIGSAVDIDDGAPVSSAEVYINGEKMAETNKNGDFIIEECQYATLEINLKANGYHDIKESAPVFSGKKISMAFKMKRHSYTVYGRALDSLTSKPIALASIAIIPAGNAPAARNLITDEFGYYYVKDIQSGTYEVKASAEDYSDLVRPVQIDSSKSYVINFIMKSKIDLSPLMVTGVFPASGDAFTDEVAVVFNKGVHKNSLKHDNFLVSLNYSGESSEVESSSFDITEIKYSPSDDSGKTVLLKIASEEKCSVMPALDVSVSGVADIYGVRISESGVVVSNRKGGSH